MGKILSVGLDATLLYTRNLVLHRTGAECVSAMADPALTLLDSQYFDVVVLCHTLSRQDRKRFCHMVELFWPVSRIILVGKLSTAELSLSSIDVAFPWRLGPLALVELTCALLAEATAHQGIPSAVLPFPSPAMLLQERDHPARIDL